MSPLVNVGNLIFTAGDWKALAPVIATCLGALITLLAATLKIENQKTKRTVVFVLAMATLSVTVFFNWLFPVETDLFNGFLRFDAYTQYFNYLLCGGTALVFMGAFSYLEKEKIHFSEFYFLILIATVSMMFLSASKELVTLFIALEMMSLAVYVLCGIRRHDSLSNEAAIKYFILGSVGAAIFLYGVAFIYGATNTTKLNTVVSAVQTNIDILNNPVFVLGLVLVMTGMFFKVAVAPFHMWLPDVYEGAPMIVTSYMSTMLKAAVFAAFIQVFYPLYMAVGSSPELSAMLYQVIWVLSLATIVVGNLMALVQSSVKRLLAYSAIAHTGYLLIGLMVGPGQGFSGVLFYLLVYAIMNIGAFGVLALLSGAGDRIIDIRSFTGLGYSRPFYSAALTVFLVSLAGLPPTAGFVAKYYLFSAAVQSGESFLVLIAVLTSVLSVYYYMRIVIQMYMKDESNEGKAIVSVVESRMSVAAISICLALVINIGIFPKFLLDMVRVANPF